MTWSRTRTLIAGLLLIAISNAIALLGVWYNRNGDPESTLHLTHRELAPPYWRGVDAERGGLELMLKWRTLSIDSNEFYSEFGSQPEWLDKAKLLALGFDVSLPRHSSAKKRREQSKQVYVALEFDGPAAWESLRRAQKLADNLSANAQTNSSMSPAERLVYEQTSATRLFAIDAALGAEELRAKYPDRSRYAITRAHVEAAFYADSATADSKVDVRLGKVINDRISVSPEFQETFGPLPRTIAWNEAPKARFEVTLAFGKRYEPWIVAVSLADK